MKTYIAFLRGINVSGQKPIKMADLKQSLQDAGFANVQTYIQSGNVVLGSQETDGFKIEQSISLAIKNTFGFNVPVLVRTPQELQLLLETSPFAAIAEEKNQYFALLQQAPSPQMTTTFEQLEFENEDFQLRSNCVYLNCKKGAGRAKLNNNLIEKNLGVVATTRNLNTMRKMIALAGG